MSGQIITLSLKEAGELWSKLSSYETNTYKVWYNECISNRQFYEGEQFTEEEKSILAERGQYAIVMNKIRKAIKGMAGLVSSSIPKYKLVPTGREDDNKVMIGNKVLDWIWNKSNGIHTYRSAVKSALVDNIAYLHVIRSKGNIIKFTKLGFDDVLVDPNAKHPLFDDAEMIVIRRYVPLSYVKQAFGIENIVSEVPSAFFSEYPNLSTPSSSGFLGKTFDVNKQYINLYECYKKQYSSPDSFEGTIVKETVIGYMHAYREELPSNITFYPTIPIYVEGYDNPFKRGEVVFLKEIQRFMNKVYGVTLLNAQLMSNPKIFIRDTDIPRGNLDEFKDNYASPSSINVITGDANPPMVVSGQPLNNAFFSLYMDAKQEFEWLTLPNEILGYGTNKDERNSSHLLDTKDSAMESLKEFLSVVELACSRLGLVCLQFAQGYIDKNTVINITDTQGNIQRVELNKKKGLDVDNPESVSSYINYLKQNEVDDESIEAELAKAKEDDEYVKALHYVVNETDFSEFDVIVVPGSYAPTYQMAMLRLMLELQNTGAIDPSVLLDYAPVEDREKLKERYDTIMNLRSQLNAMAEELEMMKHNVQSANNQIISTHISAEQAKAKTKLDKALIDAKLKALRDKFLTHIKSKEELLQLEQAIREIVLSTKHEMFLEKVNMKYNEQGVPIETYSEGTSVADDLREYLTRQ